MQAVDLLCSRNARPQKALVGRAQLKINSPQPSNETIKWERKMRTVDGPPTLLGQQGKQVRMLGFSPYLMTVAWW